jgi:hypothetical protein
MDPEVWRTCVPARSRLLPLHSLCALYAQERDDDGDDPTSDQAWPGDHTPQVAPVDPVDWDFLLRQQAAAAPLPAARAFSIGRPQHRRCFYCDEWFTSQQQPCSHAVCLADGRILCLQEGCKAMPSEHYSTCASHQAISCRSFHKDKIPKPGRCERFRAGVYTFSNPLS